MKREVVEIKATNITFAEHSYGAQNFSIFRFAACLKCIYLSLPPLSFSHGEEVIPVVIFGIIMDFFFHVHNACEKAV